MTFQDWKAIAFVIAALIIAAPTASATTTVTPGSGGWNVNVGGKPTPESPQLHSKSNAESAGKYLNDMETAALKGDKAAYDHAANNLKALEQIAEKQYMATIRELEDFKDSIKEKVKSEMGPKPSMTEYFGLIDLTKMFFGKELVGDPQYDENWAKWEKATDDYKKAFDIKVQQRIDQDQKGKALQTAYERANHDYYTIHRFVVNYGPFWVWKNLHLGTGIGTAASGPTTPIGGSGVPSIGQGAPSGSSAASGPTTPIGGSGVPTEVVQPLMPPLEVLTPGSKVFMGPTTPLGGSANTQSAMPATGTPSTLSNTSTMGFTKGGTMKTKTGTPVISSMPSSTGMNMIGPSNVTTRNMGTAGKSAGIGSAMGGKTKTTTVTKTGSRSSSQSGTTMNTMVGRPTISIGGGGGFGF